MKVPDFEFDDLDFDSLDALPTAPAKTSPPEPKAAPQDPVKLASQAELGLIASCLMDEGNSIEACLSARLRSTAFVDPVHRLLFEIMAEMALQKESVDDMSVMDRMQQRKARSVEWIRNPGRKTLLDWAGGVARIQEIQNQVATTAHAAHWLRLVKAAWLARTARIKAERAIEKIDANPFEAQPVLKEFRRELERVELQWDGGYPEPKRFSTFGYPESDDQSCLLGNDYLNRGGVLLLVSYAGQGKSSMTFGMAVHWAIGRPYLGIRSRGPMRILLIQAEDDHRYLGKLAESCRQAMELTEEECRLLEENLMIVTDRTHLGEEFGLMVKHYAKKFAPDLVMVNPLYLYAEGDITKNDVAAKFITACEKANEEQSFGYIIVHHTGKPPAKDPKGGRAEVEDWESMYMGFGSSFITNWPRATMLLEPTKVKGKYVLKLGKGGYNAGVSEYVPSTQGAHEVPRPTSRIPVRHSRRTIQVEGKDFPMIFWEPVERSQDSAGMSDQAKRPNAGRKGSNSNSDARMFLDIFPKDKPMGAVQLHRLAQNIQMITKGTFTRRIEKLLELGEIRQAPNGEGYVRNFST